MEFQAQEIGSLFDVSPEQAEAEKKAAEYNTKLASVKLWVDQLGELLVNKDQYGPEFFNSALKTIEEKLKDITDSVFPSQEAA